jgi:hypothetical protein
MGVDQSGQESLIAKIDDFGALGVSHLGADFRNAISADEDFGRTDDASGFHVEQAGGVNDR